MHRQERMSFSGSFLSDEQFLCSICLDVFNNPSTTSCGHSFCMACINRYWDGSKIYQCPLCKKTFPKRPEMPINRTLKEIIVSLGGVVVVGGGGGRGGGGGTDKRGVHGGGGKGGGKGGGGGGGGGGGIPNDLLKELVKKLPRPTLKKSLTLPYLTPGLPGESMPTSSVTPGLASSVPDTSPLAAMMNSSEPTTPPLTSERRMYRRRFTVGGHASSLSLPVCEIHHRGLVIYCRTDQECICPECETIDHQDHDTVTLEAEWMETKGQLSVSQQEIQEMISQRISKIEEIRQSANELMMAVERETAGSVSLFTELVTAIRRSQAELMEVMEMSRRAAQAQADAMILQLELEVAELRGRESSLADLAQSEDYMHCIKMFPILSSPPPAKDWSEVTLSTDLGTGPIYRSLADLVEKFGKELKNFAETGFPAPGFPASVTELSLVRPQPKRVQEYAVDVTLDCNTAHPRLILTEDMKSVKCGDKHQLLPDNPERFDRVVCVVGREAISSGRHYWEVEVGGKTDWDLGVARQSINRKGKIEVTPSNGYWFLSLRDKNKYAFRSEPSTDVHLNLRPQRIGIYVDFEKGQVSFYNVDAKIHIYTFNDTFSECIFPFFSPCTNKSGKNDGPLVIKPVNMTE